MSVNVFLTIAFVAAIAASPGDPSDTPLPDNGISNRERYRVLGDFNGDGLRDFALSQSLSLFGNGGGPFDVYLADSRGGFRRIGETSCFPSGMVVEEYWRFNRLWVFRKMGGSEGYLGYHEIRDSTMTEFRSIEVFPGDGGTRIGNAILDAVMANSDVRLEIQMSKTVGDSVIWLPWR
jgi:hypothetical protein